MLVIRNSPRLLFSFLAKGRRAFAGLVILATLATAVAAGEISRQEALEHVLAGTGVTVEWRDRALAEAPVRVTVTGSTEEAVTQLLTGTSYSMVYSGAGNKLARIIVAASATGRLPAAVSTRKPAPAAANGRSATSAELAVKKRIAVRDQFLHRIQATAADVERRLAQLPPGTKLIRNQAVRLSPGPTPGQLGNIPLLSTARPLKIYP
jgi:hypothetical protein